MILILFLQGVYPNIAVFFATHFSICHSFLDSLYMAFSRHSGKLFVRPTKYPLPFDM